MSIFSFSNKYLKSLKKGLASMVLAAVGFSQILMPVRAGHVSEAVTSSSLDANWPSGPSVNSQAAILIEAETGTILYEKNIHQKMYPASITKTLTTLIAYEMCELDEQVTFTQEALSTIPYDSSRIWVDRGNYMDMEDCLAAILIMSANDVAAGVAEHIGGTLDAFADIMNERAEELGCLNTHFVNSHGYHDPDHYTTAYDMAQIGRAFFDIDLLCTLAKERNFKHGPTDGQPKPINEWNQNKLLATRAYEYEYLVGSKTGYTSDAGQTLISCAQKDGMKLICVVLNAVTPNQYKDTISLFDFGFSNFTTLKIAENDQTYITTDTSYSTDAVDVLGDSTPLLSMNMDSIIVLPKAAAFEDTTSYITMNPETEGCMAVAHYQYGTRNIGNAQIYVTATTEPLPEDLSSMEQTEPIAPNDEVSEKAPADTEKKAFPILKTLARIIIYIVVAGFVIFALLLLYRAYARYHYSRTKASKGRPAPLPAPTNKLVLLFISFVQLMQGLLYSIVELFTPNRRKRYKKHRSSGAMSQGRTTSREYYKNSTPSKPKNVVFHDLNENN